MTMTPGSTDRSDVTRLAANVVLTGRGSRILAARLLRLVGALIVGLSFFFTQVADAAGAEHQAGVAALAPSVGDSAGGNGEGDTPPESPAPLPGVAPAPEPTDPTEEPAPPETTEPPDVAPAPEPTDPTEEPAPPETTEPPDVAPAPPVTTEPPDVAPAPEPPEPSEEPAPTQPSEPPVVNPAPTDVTDPPEPAVEEGPRPRTADAADGSAREGSGGSRYPAAAQPARIGSEHEYVSRPIASAQEARPPSPNGAVHSAPTPDRARPTSRSRAPVALVLDQPSSMRADSDRCGLGGIEDCAEVVTASAASVIALATPRIPTTVSVAVEFGKAGQGWAGAIVFNLWLRRQLRERRMSQRQLAHLSGVNHSTISRLLAGDRIPSLETATKLAQALRVPNEDIAAELGFVTGRPAMPMQRVEAALRGDEGLDEADVRELMEAYIARRRRLNLRTVDATSRSDPPA